MGDELTIIDYIPKRKNGNWLSDDFRAQEILQRFCYDITIWEGLNKKEKKCEILWRCRSGQSWVIFIRFQIHFAFNHGTFWNFVPMGATRLFVTACNLQCSWCNYTSYCYTIPDWLGGIGRLETTLTMNITLFVCTIHIYLLKWLHIHGFAFLIFYCNKITMIITLHFGTQRSLIYNTIINTFSFHMSTIIHSHI